MGIRDKIIVPGLKGTNLGKKMAINQYINEYSRLLSEREHTSGKVEELEELLGLTLKPCHNIDELINEGNRLSRLRESLLSIHSRGKEDISQLTKDEALQFQRLTEMESLNKQIDTLSIDILAIRQGLMNIADPQNSVLRESLQDQYKDTGEFISHSSVTRLIDFLNACKKRDPLSLPDNLSDKTVTDLVVSNGTSPQARNMIESSPLLRKFVDKLNEINSRTGYISGKYPLMPFAFDVGKLKGEILISSAEPKERIESKTMDN